MPGFPNHCTQKSNSPGGEHAVTDALSSPIGALPVDLMLTFAPGSSELFHAPIGCIGAFCFTGAETSVPISGSIRVRLDPTADPNLAQLTFLDTSGIQRPPFVLEGHQIAIGELSVTSESIQVRLDELLNNVQGTFSAEVQLMIDGSSFTIVETAELVSDLDRASGAWDRLEFGARFAENPVSVDESTWGRTKASYK